ncbi:hypothetical protein TELCIR_09368 [Teladorsagia circumcincta]|uniref:Uncharacterized protein n=1 Tax=Teladorsagia circumcincta TaxID=45464 RepID=A0A2G9UH57_TELCI|nr:hypothetical protein TELCIR_09368 [Teladorsagia circumcincta]
MKNSDIRKRKNIIDTPRSGFFVEPITRPLKKQRILAAQSLIIKLGFCFFTDTLLKTPNWGAVPGMSLLLSGWPENSESRQRMLESSSSANFPTHYSYQKELKATIPSSLQPIEAHSH